MVVFTFGLRPDLLPLYVPAEEPDIRELFVQGDTAKAFRLLRPCWRKWERPLERNVEACISGLQLNSQGGALADGSICTCCFA